MGKKTRTVRFLIRNLSIPSLLKDLTDIRRFPKIPLQTILSLLFLLPVYSLSSLLSLDLWGRTEKARALFGTRRALVASDSTLERVLKWLFHDQLEAVLGNVAEKLQGYRLLSRSLGENRSERRLGIIDGSFMSGSWLLFFILAGKSRCPLAIRRMRGQGDEMDTAKTLLEELPSLIDRKLLPELFLLDALYFTAPVFRKIRTLGSHVLVKFEHAEYRSIGKDAALHFQHFGGEIEAEGYDADRLCSYRIRVMRSVGPGEPVRFAGFPVQITEVAEHYSKREKDRQNERFWAVTTDLELSPPEIREAAHLRWQIENNLFRELNSVCGTKRGWTRHRQEFLSLLYLLSISFAALDAAKVLIESSGKRAAVYYQGAKRTWRSFCRVLCEAFPERIFSPP